MIKETITYTDYNGTERTEDFMFNLTKTELTEMEIDTDGGLSSTIKRIVDAKDQREIMKIFKTILFKSYGEKSLDGRRFVKSDEISKAFSETPAWDKLFNELCSDSKKAADFVNGIIDSAMADVKATETSTNSNSTTIVPMPTN